MIKWAAGLILLMASQSWGQGTCLQKVNHLYNPPVVMTNMNDLTQKASHALGRSLVAKEAEAIEKAQKISRADVYTPAEVLAQDKILKKAGLSADEIGELRKKNVLGNSVVSTANGAPQGVELRALDMRVMTTKDAKNLREGQSMNYVMGENGNLYVTNQALDFPKNKLVVTSHGTDGSLSTVVREAGTLEYDAKAKSFSFRSQYGFDTSAVETREMMDNISTLSPGFRTTYKASPGIPHSRVIKCLDILSAQSNGKNFVLDRMISENMVTITSLAVTEAAGAGRLKTDEGRKVILADIIGGNVTGAIGSVIGKHLILKDSNFMTSMAVRSGMGLGMIEVQKNIHGAVLNNNSENGGHNQTAEDIATFNRMHFFARLPVNHYMDQFFVKKLPNMIFDSCQRRPTLSVLVSPRSVRIYERYASATLYYGLRGAIIGQ